MMNITNIDDISNAIERIWNSEYMNDLAKELPWIRKRGYVFAHPVANADLLITGINPSFRKEDEEKNNPKDHGDARYRIYPDNWKKDNGKKYWDTYFGPMWKMLNDKENNICLMDRFDYLDIFNYSNKFTSG